MLNAIMSSCDLPLSQFTFIHAYNFTALQRYSTIGEEIRRVGNYHVELEIKLFEKFETITMSKDEIVIG